MPRKIKNSNITSGALTSVSLNDTGVTAGQYGSSTAIPVITTNAKGQLTAVSTASLPSNLATETYVTNSVNTAISNLVDAAPTALNTLNELAAALGDDANYASTVTTSLSTKVDKINITGATVGSNSAVPVITYNAQGQITATSTASLGTLATVSPTGTANTTTFLRGDNSWQVVDVTGGARAAVSFTAGSGAYNSSTGVFTIPTNTNQLTNGAGYLSTAVTALNGSTGSINLQDLSVFGRSISGSGYQKLPGGLWIQWGITAYIADYGRAFQSFPVAFPNASFAVTCQNVDSEDASWMDNLRAYDLTTTGFTMYRRGNNSRNWFIAIGY